MYDPSVLIADLERKVELADDDSRAVLVRLLLFAKSLRREQNKARLAAKRMLKMSRKYKSKLVDKVQQSV